ncbi:MAG TPA: ribonuclease HI [bacterium]|nr:ribonuclease HI [Candidatus Omnitrophota bacterium]HOJ62658.1 ribonuclease HI [bacterium]HOL93712.1 ribonuclease HI [bacterium]HPO99421.1 ribonuclease HI [bacterium]HXK95065.1 ribonuclease HI [bacterium]
MARTNPTSKQSDTAPEVILYTDGACRGNPGPGGWGFILIHVPTGKILEASGGHPHTTNNRMELQAVIEGLEKLKRPTRVHVVTDSAYVVRGINEWIKNWKRHNWKHKVPAGWETIKNVEYWKKLDAFCQTHQITFEHVPGHAGHPQNERCDELAVQACQAILKRS